MAAVELKTPKSLLGRTTAEAMQSGHRRRERVARIDGLIDMIWADYRRSFSIAALMTPPSPSEPCALRGLLELVEESNTPRP